MTQYMMSVLFDENSGPGTEEEMAAVSAFNRRLQAAGHWVFANGLADPESATVVDGRGAEPVFTDGPYIESKEYIGGLWIIEAPHLDVALRLAAEGSEHCNRRVELRPCHSA
ncbi:YciI family protein [Paractinoplanes ferrugineus]|nr:YciI family protein [Actinoplanes ferrugineus]